MVALALEELSAAGLTEDGRKALSSAISKAMGDKEVRADRLAEMMLRSKAAKALGIDPERAMARVLHKHLSETLDDVFGKPMEERRNA